MTNPTLCPILSNYIQPICVRYTCERSATFLDDTVESKGRVLFVLLSLTIFEYKLDL
jgi:hypothetical protein